MHHLRRPRQQRQEHPGGIAREAVQLSRFSNRLIVLTNSHSHDIELHALLFTPGATPEVQLAKDLGVALFTNGRIDTDIEQQSNVAGVHAAGDVPRLHGHQIALRCPKGRRPRPRPTTTSARPS